MGVGRRNQALAAVVGVIFFAAWWVFIDGVSHADANGEDAGPGWIYAPGILATFGFFLFSNLEPLLFKRKREGDDVEITTVQRIVLVLSIVVKMASLIVAIWLFVEKRRHRASNFGRWRGITVMIQSALICLASFAWQLCYAVEVKNQQPHGGFV